MKFSNNSTLAGARLLLVLIGVVFCSRCAVCQEHKLPFTVRDSIQTRQLLYQYGSSPVSISPDGTRYLLVLEQGDIPRNGTWVQLVSGLTTSIQAARRWKTIARMFSRSTAPLQDLIKDVRWSTDSSHIIFLWDDGEHPQRIVTVNVATGRTRTICAYSTPIAIYDISRDGRTLIFMAQGKHDLARESELERTGFAVTEQSLRSILEGNFDGWTPYLHYDTFVRSGASESLRKVHESEDAWFLPPLLLRISPNGHYALSVQPARNAPVDWDNYTNYLFKHDYLPAARMDPSGPNLIEKYSVIDIADSGAHALWDAPVNLSAKTLWSPDGASLIIGPTFLPIRSANSLGLAGEAVVEVNVVTGKFASIPVPHSAGVSYAPTRWIEDGTLVVTPSEAEHSSGNLYFRKICGHWKRIDHAPSKADLGKGVRIDVVENPNTPPAVYAVDRRSDSRALLFDVAPGLRRFTLGRVQLVHWSATDGRAWSGMLYYPVGYRPGRKYPLVIQTHGYSATQFSLDGSFTTAFAAQELANRGIAVLQAGGPDSGSINFTVTPGEPKVYAAGFDGAISHFVGTGLVDPNKVGIIGFSRTGWIVEYMLTHPQTRLAAAEVADNMDASYVQYVISDGPVRAEFEADLGARPQGRGLEAWSLLSPGFNAYRVETPLRIEVDSGPIDSVLSAWEMFSNLRYLGKPVELFVIPDIQHGVHILQNPAQRFASQQGTVDWFCFWLEDKESENPATKAEYDRWRRLKSPHKSNQKPELDNNPEGPASMTSSVRRLRTVREGRPHRRPSRKRPSTAHSSAA